MVPLLSPSLLKAIALVYWFGKQGILTDLLFGHSIYGPIGIVMASVFWTFPHAVLIIGTALALSDVRLYEGRRGPQDQPFPRLLHRHPARRPLRHHQRRHRGVHPCPHRLRRAEGDRRQLQRDGHRHLQGGHRSAELRDGGGGIGHPADPGGLRLRHRPHRDTQGGGPAFRPRGALRTEAELAGRQRHAGLLSRDHGHDAGHSRDGPVRSPGEVLALQPRAHPGSLLVRGPGRRVGRTSTTP